MKKLFLFIGFLTLIIMTGCQVLPIMSPAINFFLSWQDGEAHKYYRNHGSTIYRAVKHALNEMDLEITEDKQVGNEGYYLVAGENDRFKITIRFVEPRISELKVRINFMGDKDYAELFYSKVDEELDKIRFDPDGRPSNRE